jgi:cholesterol transport system auxiliary component
LSRRGVLAAVPGLVAGLGAAGTLGGCAAVGLSSPPQLYGLSAPRRFAGDLPSVHWQLLIDTPVAAAGLDTSQIAVVSDGGKISYVAGANWVDRAPVLVQSLLLESFENSGRIVAVAREAVGLRADFVLKAELREFQADYSGDPQRTPARARVRLNAKLVRMPGRTIVASQMFEQQAVAPRAGLAGTIAAFDAALAAMLADMVPWTLQAGQAAAPGT